MSTYLQTHSRNGSRMQVDKNPDNSVKKNRIQTMFQHGGIGDDEMQFYLGLFTAQRRPLCVVMPFMYVDEIVPFEGHFVLPFILDEHWGILYTENNPERNRTFCVITDRDSTFQLVRSKIVEWEPQTKIRKHWNFSMMLEPRWCGYEALYSLAKQWKVIPADLQQFNPVKVDGILKMLQINQDISGSLLNCTEPEIENMAWNLRSSFVLEVLENPSTFSVIGFGNDEGNPMFAQISAALVSKGVDKHNALNLAQRILQTDDPRIQQMKNKKQHKMVQMLSQIAVQNNIPFPKMNKGQAVSRLQRFFREKRERQLYHRKLDASWLRTCTFPPNQFQVVNGHWLQIQTTIQALVESVAIATTEELQPIVANEKVLGPGAHAAIMMEQFPNLPTPFSQVQKSMEVVDNMGNHALIKIWLIQLGTKKVVKSNPKDAQANTEATTTTCIKAFFNLLDEGTWNEIVRSPVKSILKCLWGEAKVSVADVWSRRFYNTKNPKILVESNMLMLFRFLHESTKMK